MIRLLINNDICMIHYLSKKKEKKKDICMITLFVWTNYQKKKKNSPINFIFGMHDRHELDGW